MENLDRTLQTRLTSCISLVGFLIRENNWVYMETSLLMRDYMSTEIFQNKN